MYDTYQPSNDTVESQGDEHEHVAGVKPMPEGANHKRYQCLATAHAFIDSETQPFGSKDVPVVNELLQASCHLQ